MTVGKYALQSRKNQSQKIGKKIFLNVPFKEKDFAKAYGSKFDWNEKKWYILDKIPDELKRYAPLSKYTFVKPEKEIDSLCKYCFFDFTEGLPKSKTDTHACVHCVVKKQPPTCNGCYRFMVSDAWPSLREDSIQIIHDVVGSPIMYNSYCNECNFMKNM